MSQLLKDIMSKKQTNDTFLFGSFDPQKQLEFSRHLLEKMGFPFSSGRLDLSTHPFSSTLHPTDNRITTRIHPTALMSNILAVLHEGGHALYGMSLPAEHFGTPLGEPISHGIHESQSRWWETRIGKSKPFWSHFYPLLQEYFPENLKNISLDTFYKAINKVEPSFIRIEADEVTYPMHIILRFELEKALIEGSLKVSEIPDAWRAKMKELLGIEPKTDSEGCLQDIHWAMGGFGYFPSYTLGNLYCCSLFSAFEKQHPEWQAHVAKGNLLFIKEWLYHNVHRYGRQYDSIELIEKITGMPFTEKPYSDYLIQKYKDI